MVGLRWALGGALLALACGRTANTDRVATNGGSPAAAGSSSGGTAASGSGPVGGQAGDASVPECPATPVAGEWVALGPDPYGFELASDGARVTGKGCLGGLPSRSDFTYACSPLTIQAGSGRRLYFSWDMNKAEGADGLAYVVRMELTSSPDRTSMAGTVWTSLSGSLDGEGQDIVVVRYPDEPVPPATECSGGEPSGDCFLRPLRPDRADYPQALELGDGNLLLSWVNQRGLGPRIASARFDAATGAWREPEFVDDGQAPADFPRLAASPGGAAMIAYRQDGALLARAYDTDTEAWLEAQVVVPSGAPTTQSAAEALLVYDGGDATLIASVLEETGRASLTAHDYTGSTRAWQEPHTIEDGTDLSPYQWAGGSDANRNAFVVWVHGTSTNQPNDLWFSSRSAGGAWTAPAKVHTTDKQLLAPAVAVADDGYAIVTWQEFTERVASSTYTFQTQTWSPPLTIVAGLGFDNRAVTFDEAGAPVAYYRNDSLASASEEKRVLGMGTWGPPQRVSAEEATGATHAVSYELRNLVVTPIHPRAGEPTPPPFERPRCEDY